MITLAKRERYFVIGAACFIGVFLVFKLLIFPFFDNRARMQSGVKEKEKGLRVIMGLSAEYEAYKRASQDITRSLAGRKRGVSLFAFLDKAANDAGVKKHIKSMDPSSSKGTGPFRESMVELKLEAVTLAQLKNYLYRIETSDDLISIKRISIKQNGKQDGYLDVNLQALTFEKT